MMPFPRRAYTDMLICLPKALSLWQWPGFDAWFTVTFPAAERHSHLTGIKLNCFVIEAMCVYILSRKGQELNSSLGRNSSDVLIDIGKYFLILSWLIHCKILLIFTRTYPVGYSSVHKNCATFIFYNFGKCRLTLIILSLVNSEINREICWNKPYHITSNLLPHYLECSTAQLFIHACIGQNMHSVRS